MNYYDKHVDISQLIGKVFTSVERNDTNEEIIFTVSEKEKYIMYHAQDCCEHVSIEDINGDLKDLVGSPILRADEKTDTEGWHGSSEKGEYEDSYTWTFYTLATIKGYVDIRWFGSSNGYYSESVEIAEIKE